MKFTVTDIANVAMMVATIEGGKLALSSLPNIEVVSLFIIVYTCFFGNITLLAVAIFVLIEGFLYGIGWWFYSYVIAWPILFWLVKIFRKKADHVTMAMVSGVFGFSFGLICELPYALMFGTRSAFSWWVAGIPFDIVHGIGNFVLCLLLYKPLMTALKTVRNCER